MQSTGTDVNNTKNCNTTALGNGEAIGKGPVLLSADQIAARLTMDSATPAPPGPKRSADRIRTGNGAHKGRTSRSAVPFWRNANTHVTPSATAKAAASATRLRSNRR